MGMLENGETEDHSVRGGGDRGRQSWRAGGEAGGGKCGEGRWKRTVLEGGPTREKSGGE